MWTLTPSEVGCSLLYYRLTTYDLRERIGFPSLLTNDAYIRISLLINQKSWMNDLAEYSWYEIKSTINPENRRLREKHKDIRNIRTTVASTPVSPAISYLSSISTEPPLVDRRLSLKSKYKSAEANYLALRRNNNYKARQYSTSTSPGMSKLN